MSNNISENKSQDLFGWLWFIGIVVVAIIVIAGILWGMYSQLVKNVVLTSAYYLRYVQLPFTFMFSDAYTGALHNLPNLYANNINTQYNDEFVIPLLKISFRSLAFIFFATAVPRAIYLIKNNDRINFSRRMNLRMLIKIMREKYPRIKPTTARWLLDEDARFGSLGSQMNPIELLVHRGLFSLCDINKEPDEFKRSVLADGIQNLKIANLNDPTEYLDDILPMTHIEYAGLQYPTGFLNQENQKMVHLFENIDSYHGLIEVNPKKIKEYYLSTLGPRCRYVGAYIDIRMLPPYERALWVLFMACITQKKDIRPTINKMLDQFSDTFVEGEYAKNEHNMDMTGIDELYEKVIKESSVRVELARIAKSHGYYYTAFMELYTVAKDKFGTITTQDFRWLRITNRILFYTLNQIGMERARFESAGVKSHYLAERKRRRGLGGKIAQPQVDSAVLNFVYSLDSEMWLAMPLTYEDIDPESKNFMRACWINPDQLN